MDICIRELEESDLEGADEVLRLAFGGPSRVDDLRLYKQMQPDGWFVAENEGRLVGMVGAANYGRLAHVGLMAVRPDCQRRGIGRALMETLLDKLERQGVPLVTLDASEKGQPLYEQLGFLPYDETHTYQRPAQVEIVPPAGEVRRLSLAEVEELAQADLAVFGADRRKIFQVLLREYPERAFILRGEQGWVEGYLFAQKFRIGPWVMLRPEKSEAMLQAALRLPFEGVISATVPSSNPQAIELLERYGFKRVRTNRRMGRGREKDPCQREKVFSQTSLAVG